MDCAHCKFESFLEPLSCNAQQRIKMDKEWGYWLYVQGETIKFFPDLSEEDINAYFAIKHPKTPQ